MLEADSSPEPSGRNVAQLTPGFQPSKDNKEKTQPHHAQPTDQQKCELINRCCFKLLSFQLSVTQQ